MEAKESVKKEATIRSFFFTSFYTYYFHNFL